ncbi:MAG TPA: type II toxin-antitoxin system VapC family toxin [Acidobacteriota bacterium]|jgi:ribonuclease VapC|nr:type II toxin-antitoxin system VapC family toxin [Acidobacteriota bacterium]
MPRRPKAIVLDSWSIIAYLEDESAGPKIADIMADAHDNSTPLLMTVVNAGEVWYLVARAASDAEADRTISELEQLGIEFVNADWKLAREAANFKSRYRMSFADCFAGALAKQRQAQLVTGDPEFKQAGSEIRIAWVD